MGFFKRSSESGNGRLPASTDAIRAADWIFDESRDQITDLMYRVDEALERSKNRTVQFISAGSKEGTSSVAWGYARASAQILKRRVLLLSAQDGIVPDAIPLATFVDVVVEFVDATAIDNDVIKAIRQVGEGFFFGALLSDAAFAREAATGRVAGGMWDSLQANFDEIVIDSPAPSVSHLGRLMASHSDGVIVVVEAEKTRDPVARKLIEDLQSVSANIVGLVLNKRKFYVPPSIYRRL